MNHTEVREPSNQKFVPVCAIGASAGGVTALQGLLRQLPTDLGLAYVVIVHLSPDQPSALGEILSVCTRMPVLQVKDAPTLKPDCVYVIPPDRELVIQGDSVTARPFSEPRGHRAPIDLFFRSIAAARGDGMAVVLSGAGSDGAQGVRAIKEAGGVVMVQEPAEASFASMPQNAIATGDADFVAPLARLAERVAEVARSKEAVRSLDMEGSANDLRRIVAFVRARTGHDFSSYKRATIMRRVTRRMQVCRIDTLAAYADHLLTTPEETKELFSDLLISVTRFFRDPQAYEALERQAMKPIFDDLDPEKDEGIRVWVVGCATGEEAYSVAMLLHEEAARRRIHPQVQVFATDLDEGALATAREGRYPRSIEADIPEARLARFFVDEGTHYRVRKELRESVLFASHSVIKEPPFLRLDLITCRNLLIYLERSMQQQLCAMFHYGLKPGRFLFLGSAETADSAADFFVPLDREARIYCARPRATQTLPIIPQFNAPDRLTLAAHPHPARSERADHSAALHLSALERNAPPSVLVDEGHNILHLSPSAGRFLLHSAGPISNQLPAVVRPELRLDLRIALTRALDGKEPTLTHPATVDFEGSRRRIAMHVEPVPNGAQMGAQALVFFLDGGSILQNPHPEPGPDTSSDEVRRLHAELKAAQEALVVSRSGHDAAIQDLRASNEELQSINEEYRSTAEELETSKEELQSINEELHTVNAELKSKLTSISAAHSDLQNLTAATEVGTLFLDSDLRIKMFTPPVAELFSVTKADIGRTISDFTHRLEYEDIEADSRRVLQDLVPLEREIRSKGGQWYVLRLRPYRTVDDRISGIVATFVDITARRQAEAALRDSEARLRTLANTVPALIWFNDAQGENTFVNQPFLDYTGKAPEDVGGDRWHGLLHPDHAEPYVAGYLAAVREQRPWQDRNLIRRADGSWRWFDNYARPLFSEDGRFQGHVGVSIDVDDAVRAEAELREREARHSFLLQLSDGLRPIADPVEAQRVAMRLLGEFLQVERAFYYHAEWFEDGWTHVVDYDFSWKAGLPIRIGRRSVSEFGASLYAGLARGEPMTVTDVRMLDALTPQQRANYEAMQLRSFVVVPILKEGRYVAGVSAWSSTARAWSEAEVTLVAEVAERTWAAAERARAEVALRNSETRFRQFAASSSDALWIRDAATLAFEFVSPAVQQIYGVTPEQMEAEPRLLNSLIVPEERDEVSARVERIVAGEQIVQEYRILRPTDGSFRWIRSTGFPLRDEQGQVHRIAAIASDITDAKLLGEHQAVLLAELQHRVRNIMAVVRSVTSRTAEGARNVEEYRSLLTGRLLTLARVQALLTRAANAGVGIRTIVTEELAAQLGDVRDHEVSGPDVVLSPKAAEVMTLAVHELTTNALKYGALAAPDGVIRVTWQVLERRGGPWLSFEWVEQGAPQKPQTAAPAARRRGFGSELIEARVPYELGGRGEVVIEASGARCHLEFPLRDGASVLETDAPRRPTVFGGALDMRGEADLSGHRILVVEDDYYLATDTTRALRGAGAEVAGPCPTEQAARDELRDARPTAAVVDINLGGGPSFGLARTLHEEGIPFVFLTGYDEEAIPAEFAGVPRLQKPIELRRIVTAVAEAVAQSRPAQPDSTSRE